MDARTSAGRVIQRAKHSRDVETAAVGALDSAPSTHFDDEGTLLRVLPFVLVAALGALLFGYHLAVVNAALAPLSEELALHSVTVQGAVVSAVIAGACAGSFAGGPVADAYGRAKALRFAAVWLALGALLCGLASSALPLLLGRLVTGFGVGVASGVVPLYISEIAPPKQRGMLGAVNQLTICTGILVALIAGLPLATHPGAWRAMFLVATLPAAALFVLAGTMLPESPTWLARAGRSAEADAAATRLWGADAPELGSSASDASAGGSSSWAALVSPAHARATLIAGGLFVIQQFAGINAVVYFSNTVFRAAGIQSDTLASAAVALVNVTGTAAAARALDRAGRKPLLLWSFAGMGVSLAMLSAALTLPALEAFAGPLSFLGTLSYVAAFAAGAGPVPALLVAELYPPALRGKGQSVAMASHWVCNFVVGQSFLNAVQAYGIGGVYAFFAGVCALGVAFVAGLVTETRQT
jgi:sugar porter (SP) family MFS transporter